MTIEVLPLNAALGATVVGVDPDHVSADDAALLLDAWHRHLVLFFPKIGLTPAQQVSMAKHFGTRFAATTEIGGADYRNAPTLADEGFPEVLLLDTAAGHDPRVTSFWHTDVTFAERPPIGSLFCMEIPADTGGDTMWSNQYAAFDRLSEPIKRLVRTLGAVHGRPPRTGTSEHPMVISHPATGRECLFVNRGWTNSIVGLNGPESTHLLAAIYEIAERPELQIRWQWSAGDAALWDNRCTMHYAVNDYPGQRRRARRVTIYDG